MVRPVIMVGGVSVALTTAAFMLQLLTRKWLAGAARQAADSCEKEAALFSV